MAEKKVAFLMRLIYCELCGDVRGLRQNVTRCDCGSSWGMYESDGLKAVYGGNAVPLGIDYELFHLAIDYRPDGGRGQVFDAFVIPKKCDTFKRAEAPPPSE